MTKVYDILNAGPNRRFTVRGPDGRPFIVHNCVQSIARDIQTQMLVKIEKRYECPMDIYDEAVALVPEGEVEEAKRFIEGIMTQAPDYMPGLPVACEIHTGYRYGEAK